MPKLKTSSIILGGVVVVALAWWIWYALATRIRLEDAMITIRYASNLAQGRGFVFNDGERVLGTTTPIQTLILAGAGCLIGVQFIPIVSTVLMAGFGALAGIGNYFLLRRAGFSTDVCILAVFLFFASARITQTSIGGMETPLVLFLMWLGAYAVACDRGSVAVVACSLLALTRPDGVLWGGILIAACFARTRRIPIAGLVIGGALASAWLAFAIYYFGSPIPHSILAKRAVAGSEEPWWMFVGWYLRCVGTRPDSPTFLIWLSAWSVGARAWLRSGRHRELAIVLIAFPVLYGAVFWIGRAPMWGWYRSPPQWACIVVIAIGVEKIATFLGGHIERRMAVRGGRAVCLSVLVAAFVVAQNWGELGHDRKYQENEDCTRMAVGLWLRDHTKPDAVVAMEAIGYQGYYSERKVVDLAGLVSPDVVAFRREAKSNAEVFHMVLCRLKPDYLVLRSFEVDENSHFHGGVLFEGEERRIQFNEDYEEVKRFSAPNIDTWGKLSFITIYGRRHV